MTTVISKTADHVLQSIRQLLGATAVRFWLDVAPVPASRPRVSRWGVYYGRSYERFRNEASEKLSRRDDEWPDGPLIVVMEIVAAKPKTTKRAYPRGDVDNFAKGPLDSLQHAHLLADDDNVVGLSVFKRYAAEGEEPGVIMHYMELPDGI